MEKLNEASTTEVRREILLSLKELYEELEQEVRLLYIDSTVSPNYIYTLLESISEQFAADKQSIIYYKQKADKDNIKILNLIFINKFENIIDFHIHLKNLNRVSNMTNNK